MPGRKKILRMTLLAWACLNVAATGCDAATALALGVPPYAGYSEIRLRFQPLADYLGAATGTNVKIRVGQSYAAHFRSIGRNEIDIAYLGPLAYIQLTERYGAHPILAGFGEHESPSTSNIVIRQDALIRHLRDLGRARFAFASPESTPGYLLPRNMLHQAGIPAAVLTASRFYGTENNVAMAVLAGDAQAEAVSRVTLDKYLPRGLQSLVQLSCGCPFVFVARADLAPAAVKKVRTALQGLNKGNRASAEILHSISPRAATLRPVDDSDFRHVREILATVQKADTAQ